MHRCSTGTNVAFGRRGERMQLSNRSVAKNALQFALSRIAELTKWMARAIFWKSNRHCLFRLLLTDHYRPVSYGNFPSSQGEIQHYVLRENDSFKQIAPDRCSKCFYSAVSTSTRYLPSAECVHYSCIVLRVLRHCDGYEPKIRSRLNRYFRSDVAR